MSENNTELSTNLTVGDIKVIATLIESCSLRGFFKAAELSIIGGVYDKVKSVLSALDAQNK